MKAQHAIQGHPESSRLWQLYIDSILKDIGFEATTHEPHVYRLPDNVMGEEVILLRQVDDFALGCDTNDVAERIWNLIDSKMSVPLKREGFLSRFNGIDAEQTNAYIKIYCGTYISKIMKSKQFDLTVTKNKPLPMQSGAQYIRLLDSTVGSPSEKERQNMEREMGFKYCVVTGELLFAMVTCRPNISNAVIKLTQFNVNPAKCHYEAVDQV